MIRDPLREIPPLAEDASENLVARPAKDYVEQKLRRVWQYQHLFASAGAGPPERRRPLDFFPE